MEYFKEIKKTIKMIFLRLKKRDFSGYTGLAIKNSSYQILTNIVAKLGSLIFTVIIARMLLPELFGLYSLALSTIMIFTAFYDFGVNQTMIRFISFELGRKNKKRARAFFFYLGRIKLFLISFSIIFLIITSKFISETYYQKPIYLALLTGAFYLLFSGLFVILKSLFLAMNNFKIIFRQEIIFQVIRIFLIPFGLLLMLKLIVNKNLLVPYIIIGLSFAYLISFIYYFINFKKIPLLKVEEIYLNKKEKRILRRFIFLTSSVIFSEIFFTYINIVMLGYFVESTFIGYYSAALSLINSSVILITFSTALLPIFTGLKKRDLNILYKKTMQIILISSTILFLLFLIFSPMIIKIIFGSKYILSVNLLRALSPLLILMPLISLSTTYLLAVGRPAIIFKILFSSILINILLNYLLISKLVISGQLFGVYGAIIATILTNLICIVLLTIYKNSKEKFKNRAIRVH